jgi:N6-adenosine-specific RNA methylase IME4
MKFRTIVADPPWDQPMRGKRNRKREGVLPERLPYPTMTLDDIKALPIGDFSETGCHNWLWTTNAFLRQGFDVMDAWGFKYLAPVTWIKPSGAGNWFVHRTQTILFGYYKKCQFNLERYLPTCFEALPSRHSEKPEESFMLIERVSDPERVELFSRRKRNEWSAWGNEIESDIEL